MHNNFKIFGIGTMHDKQPREFLNVSQMYKPGAMIYSQAKLGLLFPLQIKWGEILRAILQSFYFQKSVSEKAA